MPAQRSIAAQGRRLSLDASGERSELSRRSDAGGARNYAAPEREGNFFIMLRLRREPDEDCSLLLDGEWKAIARRLRLSPRELQIVRHIAADEKERAIAARLDISAHTVHTHLRRIYEKLGVDSRVKLVTEIFRQYVACTRQGGTLSIDGGRPLIRRAA